MTDRTVTLNQRRRMRTSPTHPYTHAYDWVPALLYLLFTLTTLSLPGKERRQAGRYSRSGAVSLAVNSEPCREIKGSKVQQACVFPLSCLLICLSVCLIYLTKGGGDASHDHSCSHSHGGLVRTLLIGGDCSNERKVLPVVPDHLQAHGRCVQALGACTNACVRA